MIDELPTAPDPATQIPSVFSNTAVAFSLAVKNMVPQFNAAIAAFNAALAGGAYAIPYIFDTATADTDPTANKLRLDNATQNAATTIRLDTISGGQDYTSVIDTFDASTSAVKGTIRLVKQGDLTKWLLFSVTARAAPTGYRNISVLLVASSSTNPFVNGDAIMLFFQRTGDQGTTYSFPVLHLRDEKTSLDGGSAVSGTQTRAVGTIARNTITGASLIGNQFTLPAGTYKCIGSAPARISGQHKATLYNVTDSAHAVIGTSETSSTAAQTRSSIVGTFTIATPKMFEIRHIMNAAATTTGLGAALIGGVVEVYTEIYIEKVA